MTRILEQLSNQADFIIIDSPPVLVVTDSTVLAPKVDGVLLVVKPGATKLQACKQALEQLKMVNANILGIILNDVDIKHAKYRYSYYRGYKYYSTKKGHTDEAEKSTSG
jgi:Mrp family chromosome partitioning ATPase